MTEPPQSPGGQGPTGPPTRPSTPPWAPPGGEGWTPAGQEEPTPDRRRPWVRVTVAVLGAIALLAGMIAYVGTGDSGDPAGTGTTTTARGSDSDDGPDRTTTSPSTSDPGVPPVSEAEFLRLVGELQAYVEQARGLEFVEDVEVELAEDREFERRLLEGFEESVDDIARTEVFYRALGLLAGERSLYEELQAIYSVGVLGFYDPETDELVVRGASPTPYVQQTIVHELVHALDDQQFELDRPQYDDRMDEIALGFAAVVEGNARRIENQWLREQPSEFRTEARAEQEAFADGIDLEDIPSILLFQIDAPYSLGEVFVDQLVDARGERGVDAALTDPPDTSEQFLDPPRFLDREPRVEVPPPPADGEVVEEGVIGALFLYGLLHRSETPINEVDALRAVDGWGGDWAVAWTAGGTSCVRADFVGDTESDTGEIATALEAWVDTRRSGSVSRTDAGRARLESCGAAPGGQPPQV